MNIRLLIVLFCSFILLPSVASADAGRWNEYKSAHFAVLYKNTPMDFVKTVAPILEQRCLRCHSADKAKGNLSLTSRESALRGGDGGPLLVPGKPDESRLIEMVTGNKPEMPAEGTPLTKADIDRLREWISAGAGWPAGLTLKERTADGRSWWSFQPVKRPNAPTIKQENWVRNDINRFVLAKLRRVATI